VAGQDDALKQYSAGVCVVGSAIGSFANPANFSRLSSMTKACSPTSTARGGLVGDHRLVAEPGFAKNAVLRSTSAAPTGHMLGL
jgi:hypothetical protein